MRMSVSERPLKTLATLDSLPGEPWEIYFGKFVPAEDGVEVSEEAGLFTSFSAPSFRDFQVVLDLTSPSGEGVLAEFSGYAFNTPRSSAPDLGRDRGPVARISMGNWPIAVTGHCDVLAGQRCQLVFLRGGGRVQMVVDGTTVLEAEDPRPEERIIDLMLYLPKGVRIHRMEVSGKADAKTVPQRPPTATYDLYACIDFYDDLIKNPWTERTFRETMEVYRKNRIKRVYFIDHFGVNNGFWDRSPWTNRFPDFWNHIRETRDNVGEYLTAAVREAHAAGLPFYAVMKPHDTAFAATVPEGSEAAREFEKIPRFGGPQVVSNHFTAAHPEFRVERMRSRIPDHLFSHRIAAIRLTADPRLRGGLDPARLRLWISRDNGTYRPYEGPLEVSRDGKEILLQGLSLEERFFALTVSGDASYGFGNRLGDLITVLDAGGNALPLTYACQDRSAINHKDDGDWRDYGFAMDMPGNGVGAVEDYFWLDGNGPLACGVGEVRYLPGALCAAYSEVTAWWMAQVERYIEAGVDGIDFRIGSHNRTFDWASFGFNQPIVDAFQARYGVDITREPFDRQAWRELRGGFYTDFLRQASARLRAAGKGIQAHVLATMQSPNWHTWKEIHYDWRGWMRDGLLDEVTIMNQDLRTAPTAAMLEAARAAGLKVNFRPYLNALARLSNGPQRLAHIMREALAGQTDGLILYENAAVLAAQKDGSVKVTCPWILDRLRERARPH